MKTLKIFRIINAYFVTLVSQTHGSPSYVHKFILMFKAAYSVTMNIFRKILFSF